MSAWGALTAFGETLAELFSFTPDVSSQREVRKFQDLNYPAGRAPTPVCGGVVGALVLYGQVQGRHC
jgi:hypothetical protein